MKPWKSRIFTRNAAFVAALGQGLLLQASPPETLLSFAGFNIPAEGQSGCLKPNDSAFSTQFLTAVPWAVPVRSELTQKPVVSWNAATPPKHTPGIAESRPAGTTADLVPGEHGNQKPDNPLDPVIDFVSPVSWSASSGQLSSKIRTADADFVAEFCPSVLWNPVRHGEMLSEREFETPLGACTDILIPSSRRFRSPDVPMPVRSVSTAFHTSVSSSGTSVIQRPLVQPAASASASLDSVAVPASNSLPVVVAESLPELPPVPVREVETPADNGRTKSPAPVLAATVDAVDRFADASPAGDQVEHPVSDETAAHATWTSISVTPAPVNSLDAEDLKQLQALCPDAQVAAPGDNYLSDLNSLLQGQSNWLFANDGLLDLAPEEGTAVTSTGTYLDELNGLLASHNLIPTVSRPQQTPPDPPATQPSPILVIPPKQDSKSYAGISPDQGCPSPGGAGVASLFQPMSTIQLNGLSTSPPNVPASSANKPTILQRPDNEACAYLDSMTPVHYFVPTRFCLSHPSRNTHILCHNPLYYEDANLERCGQGSGCLTTAVSAVHFGTAIAFTPYLLVSQCPTTCEQSLPDCPTCHEFK